MTGHFSPDPIGEILQLAPGHGFVGLVVEGDQLPAVGGSFGAGGAEENVDTAGLGRRDKCGGLRNIQRRIQQIQPIVRHKFILR